MFERPKDDGQRPVVHTKQTSTYRFTDPNNQGRNHKVQLNYSHILMNSRPTYLLNKAREV